MGMDACYQQHKYDIVTNQERKLMCVGKWNNHTLIMFAKTRLFANLIFFDILDFWNMSHHRKIMALKLTKWIFLLNTIFGKFWTCITENDEKEKMSMPFWFVQYLNQWNFVWKTESKTKLAHSWWMEISI